jgi:hypothetical protein
MSTVRICSLLYGSGSAPFLYISEIGDISVLFLHRKNLALLGPPLDHCLIDLLGPSSVVPGTNCTEPYKGTGSSLRLS